MTFVVVLIFTIIPEVTNLKKSKMLYNWPKLLVVTQIVRFGSHDLEIRSDVSSFSVCGKHSVRKLLQMKTSWLVILAKTVPRNPDLA